MGRYVRNVAAPAMPTREDFESFADHARKLVDDQVMLRLGQSASELNRLAEVLRTASARLDGTFTAPYFESAAAQIDRAAAMVKNASLEEIANTARRVAKQNPWLFIGGALVLGIGAGRFLRSSGLPALPSATTDSSPRASTSARSSTRRQKQASFSNTRDES